jgi:AAA15 family ATPase/GTPase
MLINFKTSNYLSFKGEVTLSLSASAIKEYADSNVFEPQYSNEKLLKTAALLGSNSAGKSNLIKAVEFMKRFILISAKETQANEPIETEVFKLSTETLKKPSNFEIEFILDHKKYKYAFNATKERVHREYLHEQRKGKVHVYFDRVYDTYHIDENLKESVTGLEKKTRQNALYLSVMAQWNVPLATRLMSWFQSLVFLNDITFRAYFNYTISLLGDDRKKSQLLKMFRAANLGFDNLEVKQFKIEEEVLNSLPEEVKKVLISKSLDKPQVLTLHRRYNEKGEHAGFAEFNLSSEESLGTQKYFAMAGYLLEALLQGGIIFIDELDARFHSHLSAFIVQFFNSIKDNPLNAQLVFSTHNTNLLSEKILRRDQIYLVEKDQFGSSMLETVLDKGRRNDASFEKEYLSGEYGAVPFKQRPQLNLFDEDDKLSLF